jgi:hypothetical protein
LFSRARTGLEIAAASHFSLLTFDRPGAHAQISYTLAMFFHNGATGQLVHTNLIGFDFSQPCSSRLLDDFYVK